MAHCNHDERLFQRIWHDECPTCTERAEGLPASINQLDDVNRIRAWHYMRARKWSTGRVEPWAEPLSDNDAKLLNCLYEIAVFFERAGFNPVEIEERMTETYDDNVRRARSQGLDTGLRLSTEGSLFSITGLYAGDH